MRADEPEAIREARTHSLPARSSVSHHRGGGSGIRTMQTDITAAIEDVLSGVETSGVPGDQTHFYEISKPWRDLGYAMIPSDRPRSKAPLKGDS